MSLHQIGYIFFFNFSLTTVQWNRSRSRWAVRLVAAWASQSLRLCAASSSPLPPVTQLMWKKASRLLKRAIRSESDCFFAPPRSQRSNQAPSETVSSVYAYLMLKGEKCFICICTDGGNTPCAASVECASGSTVNAKSMQALSAHFWQQDTAGNFNTILACVLSTFLYRVPTVKASI